MRGIDRRDFFKYSGAALGTTLVGCSDEYAVDPQMYDVCVVGSGFAGIFLALETVEKGLKTIVVEAGPDLRKKNTSKGSLSREFTVSNKGTVQYPANGQREIAVGGTSNHWGGAVTRMRPVDFQLHSEFGVAVDWPITYEELAPYYCRAERLLDTTGHPPVPGEPLRKCEYPYSRNWDYKPLHIDLEGQPTEYFNVASSKRGGDGGPIRLTEHEVPRFQQSKHATLVSDHQAVALVTNDGRTIDHVQTRSRDNILGGIRARIFVVAAGTVETPRLLLLSRSKWFPDGLGNQFDVVGRYFTVHPSFDSRFETKKPMLYPEGSHRTSSLSNVYIRSGLNACHFQFSIKKDDRSGLRAQPEILPQADNRIVLNRSADRFGTLLPEIRLNYSDSDKRTLERCEEFIHKGKILLGAHMESADDWQRFRGHPAGTCRMASDPKSGVVNTNNQVFGVDNLYLSGACVFPTAGTANPTDTVVAMTLRLADILIRRLRG